MPPVNKVHATELNQDVVFVIASFLPVDEMIKLRRVNNMWKQAIYSDQNFWQQTCYDHYKLEDYFNNIENDDKHWLDKLLGISSKIPKIQNNSLPRKSMMENLQIVNNYKSPFELKTYSGSKCTTSELEELGDEKVTFIFSKEIS